MGSARGTTLEGATDRAAHESAGRPRLVGSPRFKRRQTPEAAEAQFTAAVAELTLVGAGEVALQQTVITERAPGLLDRIDVRRMLDVLLAGGGLIFASPFILVAIIAIRLDSAGSPLFRQERIGRDGRRFKMLKLRTMFERADEHKEALAHHNASTGLFKIPGDPRITRVGRILRANHFDEVTQLWNVVRGDMSLIGPRPLVPVEHAAIPDSSRVVRESVRPGITGPWQVLGPLDAGLDDLVELDVAYVLAGPSAKRDVALLLRTVGVIAGRRGH